MVLPMVWIGLYVLWGDFSSWWFSLGTAANTFRLAWWPSSILLMGDPEERFPLLWAASVILNGVVFAAVGWAVDRVGRSEHQSAHPTRG